MSWKKTDAKRLIGGVWTGEFKRGRLPLHLFQFTANELTEAFERGWNEKLLTNPDIQSPDLHIAQSFQRNLWYFSANKTAKHTEILQGLMHNADGTRKPQNKFVKEALEIDKKFNAHFLATEYNTTFRLAESGREWAQIEATKESFPILEFIAVNDPNTRHSHSERHGIKLPVDDAWWLENMPPLDYNCRCRAKQHRSATKTDMSKIDIPRPPQLFRNNVLKSRKVWQNDKHPFGQNMSKEQKAAARGLVAQATGTGTFIRVSKNIRVSMYHGKNEIKDNLITARILEKKHEIELLAVSQKNGKKSADARVDGTKADFKVSSGSKNSIQVGIKQASKQEAAIVVIRIEGQVKSEDIVKGLFLSFGERNKTVREAWLVVGRKTLKTGRWLSKKFIEELTNELKKKGEP